MFTCSAARRAEIATVMKRRLRVKRTTYPLLLVLLVLLVAALGACVRPVPGVEEQPATATPPGAIINPTVVLPTLPPGGLVASPTPLPVAPVEASPTPLPPAPVDPTAAPVVVEPTAAPSGETIHVVQAGENLFRIGLRYGFTAQELATYNNIPNVDVISVGQEIRIPAR
jgi:LysM repeat protein